MRHFADVRRTPGPRGPGLPWLATLLTLLLALMAPPLARSQQPPPFGTKDEPQLRQAIEDARTRDGEVSEASAVAWRELADHYWSAGQLADTAAALQRSLSIVEALEPDGLAAARLMQNLAAVHTTDNRPELALPLHRRALDIRERVLGPSHPDLAVILLNVGDSYRAMGRFAEALPPMQRALALREAGLEPDHADIGWATSYLGRLHREVGDYPRALAYLERTLAVREKALGPTHRFVSRSLSDLALVLRDMGRYDAALPPLERAAAIDAGNLGPDHPNVVSGLSSLGLLSRDMGDYGRALSLFDRALKIDEKSVGASHPRVAARLAELASVYQQLGDLPQAIALYRRALAIDEAQPQPLRPAIAARLESLGAALARDGRDDEALALLQRSLALCEQVYGPDHRRVADALQALSRLYRRTGQAARAEASVERALRIEEASGGAMHPRIATALLTLGGIRQSAGDVDAAAAAYARALAIASRGDQPEALWQSQQRLALLAASRSEGDLSIYWGKQAVNTVQGMRSRLTALPLDLQRSFLGERRPAYVTLADQLIATGRLAEAQEVLAMLKEEELLDYVSRGTDALPGAARSTQASYVGVAESAAQARWLQISGELARLGSEAGDLARRASIGLTPDEQARRTQLESDLVLANQRFDRFLAELSREFASADPRRAEALGARQLRNLVVMQDVLAELGSGTVLLHYVVAENRVAIIVTTADAQIAREARISAADLNRKVLAFRVAMAARQDVKKESRELHELLIGPVAADLKQAKARVLMLSLDGTLRYLPFAALHDGQSWLVERYGLALYAEAARAQLTRPPKRDWTMTGLGVTRAVPGFAALPAVREELEGIRRGGMGGDVFLDEQFTAERFRSVLAAPTPVLHIASHFQFKPGTFANSFLVLGDGARLSLQDIRDRRLRFSNVDLLTLSACDTAMGGGTDETGAEVEGFGALAQQQGAAAVLATLWPVADGSTSRFMQIVYSHRADARLSKAAAVRDAQLAFVRGRLPGPAASTARLAHPFYWAPYVLMGNWR